MTIASELGEISRFASPRQLMGYSGAVPSPTLGLAIGLARSLAEKTLHERNLEMGAGMLSPARATGS
ncbi:MAG: hypothetical protein ACP5E5_15595 [Acidobacteriaceae bacterium]